MTVLTAPEGLIAIGGTLVPRRRGFTHRDRPVICGRGHVLARQSPLVEGVSLTPCPECELWVFAVSVHADFQFRADLTGAEATEIQKRGWRLWQVFKYTGAALIDGFA